jgi:hypothetical protein
VNPAVSRGDYARVVFIFPRETAGAVGTRRSPRPHFEASGLVQLRARGVARSRAHVQAPRRSIHSFLARIDGLLRCSLSSGGALRRPVARKDDTALLGCLKIESEIWAKALASKPGHDEERRPARIRSAHLTIFGDCGCRPISSRKATETRHRQRTVNGFGRGSLPKGPAMLIRSGLFGVRGKAAIAAGSCAIPAASLPTLLLGGLLLICP